MFDNRIFNVNGENDEDEQLLAALKLIFAQSGCKAEGWSYSKKYGLILYWHCGDSQDKEIHQFPAPMTAERVFPVVKEWLGSKDAAEVECVGEDANLDHDGHNEKGWRVYCEYWGHVADSSYAFCAIKPVYCWYGK